LTFDDSKDVTLRAKNIWIPKGNFTAGTALAPFTHKLTIEMNSLKDDSDLLVIVYIKRSINTLKQEIMW